MVKWVKGKKKKSVICTLLYIFMPLQLYQSGYKSSLASGWR